MRIACTLTIVWGGGVPAEGGVPARGGTCPGVPWGVLAWGVPVQGGTCPGGLPAHGGACLGQGGTCPGGWVPVQGVSCDLSHHAFDVTYMLPPHQQSVSTSAAAYIVWPRCMLGYNPPLWTEWQTGAKILPCPKLRLRVVTMDLKFSHKYTLHDYL